MYRKPYFRYDWSATRKRVQSEQIMYMLNGVTIKVRMTRSKDSFVLMAKSDVTESFKVYILSAKVFVRKLKITPSLCLAHERILQQTTAKYHITRVGYKVIHLPQGQTSITHDNLFLGQLPKSIVLGLVDTRAFNGDISLNPYNFQHCKLSYLAVHLDGQVPWARYSHYFPDRVIYVPSTLNLLEETEYLVTLGTQLDESSLSTDTPCTLSI